MTNTTDWEEGYPRFFKPAPDPGPTPSLNLSRARLGACIDRLRGNVTSAERALIQARKVHEEAVALIESDAEWTAQDAIYAHRGYIADFEIRLQGHRAYLQHHEALFLETHREAYPRPESEVQS